jgi:hypothetical protein
MAKLAHSFTMDVPPEQAQAMFVRDLVPDLHKDGDMILSKERAGRLDFSYGPTEGANLDLLEVADPDVVGHPEENDEPAVRAVEEREPFSFFPAGPGRIAGSGLMAGKLEGLGSPHIEVTFAAAPEGTLVTLKGHIERHVHDAILRLGTQGHWPEIANDPHD